MTAEQFNQWLSTATRGARLEYHRGYLIRDRSPNYSSISEAYQLSRLADAVLDAAYLGLVHLCQERHGNYDYHYLAVKG